MKVLWMLVGFLACLSSARADMLGINIELSRTNQGPAWQTLVSIQAGYLTNYNRVNVSVKAAAEDLRKLRFDLDGKFAVIHSASSVPVDDLMPILEAMSANQIGLDYIQIGQGPPSGMDIWNRKSQILASSQSADVYSFRHQMPWGILGKQPGTQIEVTGEYRDQLLWIDAIDGIYRGNPLQIKVQGIQLRSGIHYKVEGYETGEYLGVPVWLSNSDNTEPFHYRSFFVVTKVIEPEATK